MSLQWSLDSSALGEGRAADVSGVLQKAADALRARGPEENVLDACRASVARHARVARAAQLAVRSARRREAFRSWRVVTLATRDRRCAAREARRAASVEVNATLRRVVECFEAGRRRALASSWRALGPD